MHVPKHFLQKILKEIVIPCFSKRNDQFDSENIYYVPEIHLLRNSYAVRFEININKVLFYSKRY